MTEKAPTKSKDLEAANELEADIVDREDSRIQNEQAVQQDLNQGMETGTHDSERSGIKWGPSYRAAKKHGTKNKA